MKPRAALLAIGLLAIALAAGLLWQRHAAQRQQAEADAVRIAANMSLPGAPILIARERGLFTRAGLEATLQECAFGKACVEVMLKGQADLALAASLKFSDLALTQKDLRILGNIAFEHTTELPGLKDRGIAGPADLKGRRVDVILGTVSEYFLARLLTLHGMQRQDVTMVRLEPREMAGALAAGQVDAVMVFSPYSRQVMAALPGRLSESDGQPGQDYDLLLMGRRDWVARHPQVAERVLLALKWATEWMAAHPAETRAFLAARYGVPEQEQGEDLVAFAPLAVAAPETVTMIRGTGKG